MACRSASNAASISPYEKFAFRPLGFGSTNIRASCTVACWKPGSMTVAPFAPSTFNRAR
jgi:hypothetical protein